MEITFSIDSLEDMYDAMCDNNVPERKASKAGSTTVPKHGFKVINYGNCMLCGKKLTNSLFFCKECEEKNRKREMNADCD